MGTARAVVDPSTTKEVEGSRLNVVPPIVTAPPPAVRVWEPPDPAMTTFEETWEAVKLPIVATGAGEVLGEFPAWGVVGSDDVVGVEAMTIGSAGS